MKTLLLLILTMVSCAGPNAEAKKPKAKAGHSVKALPPDSCPSIDYTYQHWCGAGNANARRYYNGAMRCAVCAPFEGTSGCYDPNRALYCVVNQDCETDPACK